VENNITVVGLDVHKDNVVGAVLPPGAENVKDIFTIENTPKALGKMAGKFEGRGPITFVYEAGCCGYDIHRQLAQKGLKCVVIAPGKIPVKSGDRVKTDRRDAEKLARLWRAGELTEVRVPTTQEEACRDLVRAREDALEDRLRARHRLSKFFLRQGRIFREAREWGAVHEAWLKAQKFEPVELQETFEAYVRGKQEADERLISLTDRVAELAGQEPYRILVKHLRCLKGIETLSALTLAVEGRDLRRFGSARNFMGYAGLGICENSSGGKIRRGGITRAGNAHLRRILVESAWSYRHGKTTGLSLQKRREGCPAVILKVARRAQERLSLKFSRMIQRNKPSQKTAVAVARELAGFVWAIAEETAAMV
jgi:transposase